MRNPIISCCCSFSCQENWRRCVFSVFLSLFWTKKSGGTMCGKTPVSLRHQCQYWVVCYCWRVKPGTQRRHRQHQRSQWSPGRANKMTTKTPWMVVILIKKYVLLQHKQLTNVARIFFLWTDKKWNNKIDITCFFPLRYTLCMQCIAMRYQECYVTRNIESHRCHP